MLAPNFVKESCQFLAESFWFKSVSKSNDCYRDRQSRVPEPLLETLGIGMSNPPNSICQGEGLKYARRGWTGIAWHSTLPPFPSMR